VVRWGIQIQSLGVSLDLSPAVTAQLESLVDEILSELAHWGIEPQNKR
jgi:Ni,Fe-hydrogenase maturation factor